MRFAVVTVWAQDVRAAAHFYRDVLGLKLAGHHGSGGEAVHFDVGGTYLVIQPGSLSSPKSERRFPLFALAVDHIEDVAARLQVHEVELPWGIETDAGSRWAMFHDPAGNLIEIVEVKA
jgi:catechol 2,3-dioxygenase-like lactoylglutathione lyase family enzyme